MTLNTLQDLLIDMLKDLYDAESQLIRALPKSAKAASSDELKRAFEEHLEQTHNHVERLDRIFELLDRRPQRKTCPAMKGLIEELKEIIDMDGDAAVLDAGLIAAAQKVEHYEIASYGSARTFAEMLALEDVADLLQETLDDEENTDRRLTQIARGLVNVQAAQA